MSQYLRYQPGELRKRVQQSTLLQEFVFDANPSDLRTIEIVTLKQVLKDAAISEAWELDPNPNTVDQTMHNLLKSQFSTIKEFVEIEDNKITVGVNAASVTDAAVDRAMMLMIQVEDITQLGKTEFGEDIQVNGS